MTAVAMQPWSSSTPQPAAAPAPIPRPSSAGLLALTPVPLPMPVSLPAPTPAPIQDVPRNQGIPIYFDDTPYYFEYRPIGIRYHRVAPVRIGMFIFNSYGKTLGLRIGQTLTRIKDVDVRAIHEFEHVHRELLDAVKDLPYWPLQIDFRTPHGAIKTIDFLERPLGITFYDYLPIKVKKFGPYSLAQRKGVQVGWEIVRIADEDTSEAGMYNIGIKSNFEGFKHVDRHLLEGLAHLPYWKVCIDFKTPSGDIKSFEFSERPLGIVFTTQPPIKIEQFRPDSLAEEMGIRAGWEIVRIGDDDVTNDFKHVDHVLERYLRHLPVREK